MQTGVITPLAGSELGGFIEKHSGQNPYRCYQCGKCSSGCPVIHDMDMGPRRAIRAVQLGLKKDVLSSNTIWVCIQCQTCSARCPLNIDIARVMEVLRLLAIKEEYTTAESDVALFHRVFLDVIRRHGRAHELELGVLYNLRSAHLTASAGLLPRLLSRGKLKLLPSTIKGVKEVRRIFARAEMMRKKASSEGGIE